MKEHDSLEEYEENTYETVKSKLNETDLLIIGAFPFYLTGYLSNKPWIAIDFGVVPYRYFKGERKKEFRKMQLTQYQKHFTRATKIVCISNFLKSRLPPSLKHKAHTIHLGIDHYPDEFLTDIRSLYKLNEIVILYVGRCMDTAPYKNVNNLLDVFDIIKKDYKKISLLISTGDCNFKEKERLENRGATIINGALNQFLPSIYNSCNIFATATEWEGFDLPLLEASYFGKPVVAHNIGAHPEIVIHEKTGFLSNSDKEFSNYIFKLINEPQLRQSIGHEGKIFARNNFKWSNTVNKYSNLINQI